jgi:hypothetical protein
MQQFAEGDGKMFSHTVVFAKDQQQHSVADLPVELVNRRGPSITFS